MSAKNMTIGSWIALVVLGTFSAFIVGIFVGVVVL